MCFYFIQLQYVNIKTHWGWKVILKQEKLIKYLNVLLKDWDTVLLPSQPELSFIAHQVLTN